ncbi:MAG: hypothetical protein CMH55_05825, partial [Myxococcales bacterium]|nr:hypothetical protein [Myxococcales bacterium]
SSVVLPQLPSVDDLVGAEPLQEELTRLSSQSSTQAARMRSASRRPASRAEMEVPGTEVTSHERAKNPALLWGALVAGLVVVLALATNVIRDPVAPEVETQPPPAETVVQAPGKAPEPITIRNEEEPVEAVPKIAEKPPKERPQPIAQPKRPRTADSSPPRTRSAPKAGPAALVSVQIDVKQRNRHFDWGMVYLNGRAVGMAPVKGAKVPAGSLKICIHNEASGLALKDTVKVSGSNMKFPPFDMAKAKKGERCP